MDNKGKIYNFDFEQGRPQEEDDVTSKSSYTWKALANASTNEKELQQQIDQANFDESNEQSTFGDSCNFDLNLTHNKSKYECLTKFLGKRKVS